MKATLTIDDSTMSESWLSYSQAFKLWRLKMGIKDGEAYFEAASLYLFLGLLNHARETVLEAIALRPGGIGAPDDLFSATPRELRAAPAATPLDEPSKLFLDTLSLGKQAREKAKAWEAKRGAAPSSQGD